MIDEAELKTIAFHGKMHEMGLCVCPCYEALLTVGRKIQAENDLRAELAKGAVEDDPK